MKRSHISLLLLATGLCLLITACVKTDNYGMRADLASKSVVYVNEHVQREAARINVRPATLPTRELSALFLPFRVRQSISHSDYLGREVGRVFFNTWVADQTLSTIQFADNARWPGGSGAAHAARALGADLVIGGDLTHFYAGGTAGDTRVALTLEVWDAISGQMLWSMEHGGMITRELTQDWIFANRESRMPADPTYAVVQALAHDLAQPVKAWQLAGITPPAPPQGNGTKGSQNVPVREQPLF